MAVVVVCGNSAWCGGHAALAHILVCLLQLALCGGGGGGIVQCKLQYTPLQKLYKLTLILLFAIKFQSVVHLYWLHLNTL